MRKFALLLLAAPLALAACASSSSTVAADPIAYVTHAAAKTADLKSEHMVLVGTISGPPQSTLVTGSGDFANSPLKASFAFSVSGADPIREMKGVFSGKTLYLSSPAIQMAPGKKWEKVDYGQLRAGRAGVLVSENPTQFLGQLDGAGSAKSLGTKTIEGVETTHYQVTNVDLSKIPQGAKLNALGNVGPIDVWIGNSDGYVYRETISVSVLSSVPGQSLSTAFRVDFSKFNEAVTVTVPPASETIEMGAMG